MHTDRQRMTGINWEVWRKSRHKRNLCHVLLALGIVLVLAVEALAVEASSLTIGLNFTSSTSADVDVIPPDTMGAVGPDHIVELINERYTVYNKQDGSLVQTSTLSEFWGAAGLAFFRVFDPRILYDPTSQRWFASSTEVDGGSFVLLAVSLSADPTAGWLGLAIDADSTHARFADFPTLGFDQDGVYLAADMIPGSPDGNATVTIMAVSKADLLAATSPITVVQTVGTTAAPTMVRRETAAMPWQTSVPSRPRVTDTPRGAHTTGVLPADASTSAVQVTVFENLPISATGAPVQPIVNLDNQGLPA